MEIMEAKKNRGDILRERFNKKLIDTVTKKMNDQRKKHTYMAQYMFITRSMFDNILNPERARSMTAFEFYRACVLLCVNPIEIVSLKDAVTDTEQKQKELMRKINHMMDRTNASEIQLVEHYRNMSEEYQDILLKIAEAFASKQTRIFR